MDAWHIPALQHTSHMWHIAEEAPYHAADGRGATGRTNPRCRSH